MGGFPSALSQAPTQPPDISGQMGAGPAPGQMGPVAARDQAASEGQANPNGALFSQAAACKAVLEQMASLADSFAPYARQAISIITNGVSAVSAMPPASTLPPDMSTAPPGLPGPYPPQA
jgi:hypothetical protein